MKHRPSFLCLALVLALPITSCGQQPSAALSGPRLVVLCSIDQMASWVFAQGEPFFAADGGFRRLQQEGVTFSHCAYQHACTETGPGHATIGTGVPAAVHGIVRNTWWSPATNKLVYCVAEPMPALPGLPEGKDRGPGRLLAPTLGDAIKSRSPASKVASVSWKDRAAILMAGGSADAVAWFENTTGNLVTNTRWGAAAPAWLSRWNEARVIDSYHGWNWDRFGPAAAYAGLVDDRPYELPHANGTKSRTLPQLVTGGIEKPGPQFFTEVYASPLANTLVRLAAQACVEGMDLGADDTPDLLCVSFSATDLVGHYFGPDSVEARDTLLRLDRELGLWLDFLDRKVGKGKYAMFLTADHGVGPTPEAAKAAGVDAGRGPLLTRARAGAEKALREQFGAPPAGKRYVSHAGEFSLFLDTEVLEVARGERELAAFRSEASRVAAKGAVGAPGILAAFATNDLMGMTEDADPLRRSLALALCADRAGDVQVVTQPYWLDGATPASHGTPHAYDREVIGFAYGAGVPAGVKVDTPVTPGLGVVWFDHVLGLPGPKGSLDVVPKELLDVH